MSAHEPGKEPPDMIVQSVVPQPAQHHIESKITADRTMRSGRMITIIMFLVVFVFLGAMLFWLGSRRVNNYFVTRADTAYTQQQYEQAIDQYSWAIRFDKNDMHSFLNRGYSYQKLQKDELAITDFSRAILLEPTQASAYRARAVSQMHLNQYCWSVHVLMSPLAILQQRV